MNRDICVGIVWLSLLLAPQVCFSGQRNPVECPSARDLREAQKAGLTPTSSSNVDNGNVQWRYSQPGKPDVVISNPVLEKAIKDTPAGSSPTQNIRAIINNGGQPTQSSSAAGNSGAASGGVAAQPSVKPGGPAVQHILPRAWQQNLLPTGRPNMTSDGTANKPGWQGNLLKFNTNLSGKNK